MLALDTSSPAVTVALHDGHRVVAASDAVDAQHHGELLAPAVARVLADAGADRRDLTDVAVGVGPGPFTGLRVGVVTARTLADALGARLHAVCSLDVLAAEVVARTAPGRDFLVATDARRREVYWARYDAAGRRTSGPAVGAAATLDLPSGTPAYGRGAVLYADVLHHVDGPVDPDAGVMATGVVAGLLPLEPPVPAYLRRPDAVPPGAARRAS